MPIRRTVCNRDCPDACSILVTVEDGKATALRGDPRDPITHGFLCERTNLFLHRQYDQSRITTPLLRKRGKLTPVAWDEALEFAASHLEMVREQSGPAAILHYRSGGSLGILKSAADYLFEQYGPVTVKHGDICSGAGEAAQEHDFGVCESSDVFDLRHSAAIVLWGKNVHTSGPHLLPILNDAKRRGARIVGIDPVRTKVANIADDFLMPRPGADYALAMAATRWLFDNDAVAKDAIAFCDHVEEARSLAHAHDVPGWSALADVHPDAAGALGSLYARGPVATLLGWGLGRRRNGSRTSRAIDALAALSGNVGIPGGGVSYYFRRRDAFDRLHSGACARSFAEARLGHEILAANDPPIRFLWVTAGNPVSMLPDSASMREAMQHIEYTVVVDTHPTDTTDLADLVLPTLTLLEDEDVMGAFGSHYLRSSTPAIAPPAGPRHELEILQGLAQRIGLGDKMRGSVRDWKRHATRRLAAAGVALEQLEQGAVRSPFAAEVLFEGRKFPTSSGRVNLLTDPAELPAPDDDFPLSIMAVSTPRAQSSQWSPRPPDGRLEVRVHPAAANGFADGAPARLESRMAALDVIVRHDDAMRTDVALLPKGGMIRNGQCANQLVPAIETDDGGGAAYYGEGVRLVAAR